MSIALEEKRLGSDVERFDPLINAGDAAIERLPALKRIFDRMAAEFSRNLASAANAPVGFSVAALGAPRVMDAQVAARRMSLASVYECNELDARIFLAVDRVFLDALVEILFGATFAEADAVEARPVTRIEARMAEHALDQLASALEVAFGELRSVKLQRAAVQAAVDFSGLGRPGSIAVTCTCLLQAFGRSGEVCVVLPRAALDPFRAALSRNPATEGLSLDEAWSKKLHDSVVQAEVKVSAVMDRKGLTLEDVARFEVGQVIQLDASPTSLIKLECESRALFWCNFGQKEGFYTVRVEECVNETEEFLQDIIGG